MTISIINVVATRCCQSNIIISLLSLSKKFPDIRVILCFNKQFDSRSFAQETNLFKVNEGVDTSWVNAWDSNSFIGNGGESDPTIDGKFVAAVGDNKYLNASYLHNSVVFSKEIAKNSIELIGPHHFPLMKKV